MVQSDKTSVDLLRGLAHIIDTNIMPIKSCVNVLGYTQATSQVNHSIHMPTSLPSVPTFTSSIVTTSTQNVNPTHLSQWGNFVNQNYLIAPSVSLQFVTQSSPIPTYHSVPPPYCQPQPTYNNVTPPSQSNTSNFNLFTKENINNLDQTISSLQQKLASLI